MPRKIFVLKIANISRAFETLKEKISVNAKTADEKIIRYSNVKVPNATESITNQNVKPPVTASDLKRGEESFNFKLDK
jgi:hypothetical protein